MSELDRMIEAALNDDDRAFFAKAGREPGYLGQVGGLLVGPLAWVNILLMIVQAALFLGGALAAWQFFQAGDTLVALRWGLPAVVLLLTGTVLKVATLWPSLQANRMLRELKRIELQLARQAARA